MFIALVKKKKNEKKKNALCNYTSGTCNNITRITLYNDGCPTWKGHF